MQASTRHSFAITLASTLLLGSIGPAAAAIPSDPAKQAAIVGQPMALLVQPETITLAGPRIRQQVVITGRYADGSVRDLTPFCTLSCAEDLVAIGDEGYLQAKKNGTGSLIVKAGAQTTKVPLTVKDVEKPQPVSFRNEVIAVLERRRLQRRAPATARPSARTASSSACAASIPAADLPPADARRPGPAHRPAATRKPA